MKKMLIKEEFQRKDLKQILKTNYATALKDEEFKKFVKSIDLSSDEKMKFTSSLEDSFQEKQNCQKCKSLLTCKNNITGQAYTPSVQEDTLVFAYVSCKFKLKYEKQNFYKKNIISFGIENDYENPRMSEIHKDDKNRLEAIKALTAFIAAYKKDKNIRGIYLHGGFGSGKTYLVTALLNEFAKINIKSARVYWPEFLRSLKEAFASGEYKQKFNSVKKVPILLIDDIGAEQITGWGRDEILGSILQHRMQEKLPTFFTSNLSISELETHLSITKNSTDKVKARRIIERIKQLSTIIEMISTNKRT